MFGSRRQEALAQRLEMETRMQVKQARRESLKAAQEAARAEKEVEALIEKGDTARARTKTKFMLMKRASAEQADRHADAAAMTLDQIKLNKRNNMMAASMNKLAKMGEMTQEQSSPAAIVGAADRMSEMQDGLTMSNDILQDAMSQQASKDVAEDAVQEHMDKVSDKLGLEVAGVEEPTKHEPQAVAEPTAERNDELDQRLRALRS